MRKLGSIAQVSFTYVGTVVGAGFATGQEILQFFTRYGWMATLTIGISSLLFVWLGIKLMLLAHDVKARSYEDLNKLLFGEKAGQWISLFTLVTMFGVTTVMLAGAGSLFEEQFHLPYQLGLLLTLVFSFIVLNNGMKAILAVNSIVVPLMLSFSCIIVWYNWDMPGSNNWLQLTSDHSIFRIWFAPFLYAAFNLTMSQGVLVPLGAQTKDRSVLFWGGIYGGVIIGLMLLAGHFALSAQMPGISQFEIPMGHLIQNLGPLLQLLFIGVIYGEIFTTLIADVYGLSTQLEQRTRFSQNRILLSILLLSYLISQFGFKTLLSTLYPLFGLVSIAWLVMIIRYRKRSIRPN
ncbi:hypothetical protein [Paenibacillus radicis (ex Xue et al. 2023)]|uniref:Membrane protein YkvI n=1 Tax=Paenibacillus radicis (ex Xue et al. 2023) TaxID=2972489 RepID=A0ABT1YD81_9BACL|nr:hypothetical protein [Paenibacillus radicis (ex Xue et al. 2023)]MCR8631148.1 hypothetical protein [Paenibacillus radicis (ex Xue et al. 2023)]